MVCPSVKFILILDHTDTISTTTHVTFSTPPSQHQNSLTRYPARVFTTKAAVADAGVTPCPVVIETASVRVTVVNDVAGGGVYRLAHASVTLETPVADTPVESSGIVVQTFGVGVTVKNDIACIGWKTG